mmetsp:Transcript_28442/g.42984  ORF Transcript_28442/g.42984 Transcript_28442/m.42984 type:complete len:508 (-) Transcript_28442:111-1634(-)|eukprot:CAMPEP_0178928498 /NCGR_PEP_ID=MMETSP0786-20121207/19939_1 /TAXON_ID=186022 /ORGANISM="Thalassionema frauenfeldii, Strain CCMP 1798" /LENGTH=507 /DNA_ID=CAMNT_0020604373 /DNA_START=353 /DNA_END=1876 /DNA_ORIENTATION=-
MSTNESTSREEDDNANLQEADQDQQMEDDVDTKNIDEEKEDDTNDLDGNGLGGSEEIINSDDGKDISEIEGKDHGGMDGGGEGEQADEPKNDEDDDTKKETGDDKMVQSEDFNENEMKEIEEDGNNMEEEKKDIENDLEENNEGSEKENDNAMISRKRSNDEDEVPEEFMQPPSVPLDPEVIKQQELIDSTPRSTELEHALYDALKRKEAQVERLTGEISKLKAFISKRKQTYKRKRKDEGAPTRALSAYNIFVQDRFSKLAKENEQALKSSDTDAQLKRVPPASLVASTGNQWKELSAEEKGHYEERARQDRKRYEEQMAKYQPPDKQANRKRNKTGYNMFFSAHVLRLKQSEAGVPSERGSVARLVGNAWKQLSAEDKQYYEREADKMNGMNPVDKEGEEAEEDEDKRTSIPEYQPNYPVQHGDMHMHTGMPPPMHGHSQHPGQHDPRQHAHYYPPNYAYGQPPYHGYHDQASQGQHRHYQGRGHSHYQYPPPHGHPYDQRGMGM